MNRILLAGDSTVTEQPRNHNNPALRYCGWGQMLCRVLYPSTQVHNFALSGLTVETFRTSGQYSALKSILKEGDFVLFQFGHNDQKLNHLKAQEGYKNALVNYINEIRNLWGVPLLVTPVARNSWRGDTGEYNDLLAPYADAVLQTGNEMDVPVLDLHKISMKWIKEIGLQKAKRYFYPGDYTHPNDFGGYKWARMLAELSAGLSGLAGEEFAKLFLPISKLEEDTEPLADSVFGWTGSPNPRYSFEEFLDSDTPLTNKEALEMAMKGYGYFSVNGAERELKYASAMQNGYLSENFPKDKLESFVKPSDFCELMIMACKGRNQLDECMVLPELGSTSEVSRNEAVKYCLDLEKAATGCREVPMPEDDTGYVPAGS